MEEDKFKDLLEDEELRALRLAALATKKKNDQNANKSSESVDVLPINSIITSATASESVSNQIPFVQSDRSGHNSWRKLNQSSRRRGGAFPKNSQRSNLIVINPTEGKDAGGKTSSLILPQHKWCNSGNEDSMSPKTLRKTGPTRFNRHGSDSESSDDSDYENSDNDSGSNETILQDEPSEHFPRSSPGCDTSDNIEKKRRLSFQSLDSEIKSDTFDKNETTSVYNLLKNSSYTDKSENYAALQNLSECDQTWNNSVEGKYSNYKQYNTAHAYTSKTLNSSSDISNTWHDMRIKNGDSYFPENSRNQVLSDRTTQDYDKMQTFSETHAANTPVWQHGEGHGINNSYYSRDIAHNIMDSKNDKTKLQCLSEDLRMELKRVQEVKLHSTNSESNEIVESKKYGQNRHRSAYKGDKTDVSTNSFGNKKESSDLYTDRSNQNFGRENDVETASNLNKKIYSDSLIRERNIQESSSTRDKNRFEYSLDTERNRNDSSSNLGRSRNGRSSSQDRSRYDRSSSRDVKKRDCSVSPNRNKQEHSYRQVTSYSDHNNAEDRKKDQYRSNFNKNRSKRSTSQDRRRYDRSSSSDSKNRRSLSQDRKRFAYKSNKSKYKLDDTVSSNKSKPENAQNREKNKHEYDASEDQGRIEHKATESKHDHSLSQDRSRYDRSSSRDRGKRDSSQSQGNLSDHSHSQEKNKHSSSQDESDDEYCSSGKRHKRFSKRTFGASKFNSIQHKIRHDITLNQDKSIQEQKVVKEGNGFLNKKFQFNKNSEKVKEETLERIGTKIQSKFIEQNRLKYDDNKEKEERNRPLQKHSLLNSSSSKSYSRSRSSSSDSYSSSYSSSSSQSSRPKIRSVPSVIKTVSMKKIDTENRNTFNENKSIGRNINSAIPQSSIHSAPTKKTVDVIDYNKLPNIKSGQVDGDLKVSDNKRVPVHMRLGAFPRKRVIQMPKDVEAAFVNSSSSSDSENVNTKCKRQNIRIVTDVYNTKLGMNLIHQKQSGETTSKRLPDIFLDKSKRVKTHR